MSNHTVSLALNGLVLKVIEGYINNEFSKNYVKTLILESLSMSHDGDGNDYEVLADVSNYFCGSCLNVKDGNFFENYTSLYENKSSLVKISDSFYGSSQYLSFHNIADKFNFNKEDISFLEKNFANSCTYALCEDCLKEAFDEITGSRDKTMK